jgi:hypothetical protein
VPADEEPDGGASGRGEDHQRPIGPAARKVLEAETIQWTGF